MDQIEACKWYVLAADQGDEDAIKALAGLRKTMPADQITEAQHRAHEWHPKLEPHPVSLEGE
jgi:hypothetical protein